MLFAIFRTLVDTFQENSSSDLADFQAQQRNNRNNYRWIYRNVFSTFRYGMVLLYVGTLMVVIGYHNPSIYIARYIGMVLAIAGILMAAGATICGLQIYLFGDVIGVDVESNRAASSDSKRSLPSYDNVVNMDLPTYEQAMILKEDADSNNQSSNSILFSACSAMVPTVTAGILWPSIGHYSTRVSPITEVEENPEIRSPNRAQDARTVQRDRLYTTTTSLPDFLLPQATTWNSNNSEISLNGDHSNVSHTHDSSSTRMNSASGTSCSIGSNSQGSRTEARNEIVLSPSTIFYPAERSKSVLPVINLSKDYNYSGSPCTDMVSTNADLEVGVVASTTRQLQTSVPEAIEDRNIGTRNRNSIIVHCHTTEHVQGVEPTVVFLDNHKIFQDSLGSNLRLCMDPTEKISRSHSITNRPNTSITRPGTSATLLLESCTNSLYEDASFDEDLSSLSDWDDLPSIESLSTTRDQQTYTASDMILDFSEVENEGVDYLSGQNNVTDSSIMYPTSIPSTLETHVDQQISVFR